MVHLVLNLLPIGWKVKGKKNKRKKEGPSTPESPHRVGVWTPSLWIYMPACLHDDVELPLPSFPLALPGYTSLCPGNQLTCFYLLFCTVHTNAPQTLGHGEFWVELQSRQHFLPFHSSSHPQEALVRVLSRVLKYPLFPSIRMPESWGSFS